MKKKNKDSSKNLSKLGSIATEPPIQYSLSDKKFIDNGWTVLPIEKIVHKMVVYKMTRTYADWFDKPENRAPLYYSTGEKLSEIDENQGCGQWYYKNGAVALHCANAQAPHAMKRYTVYSSGEPALQGARRRPHSVLATFDLRGNGIVFDYSGKVRLKYNQSEGIILDHRLGPLTHWKWHSLNDPPILEKVYIDSQLIDKDDIILNLGEKEISQRELASRSKLSKKGENKSPTQKTAPNNTEETTETAIESKLKLLRAPKNFNRFAISYKIVKINENFSLRIFDQKNIRLQFSDACRTLKLEVGLDLDTRQQIDEQVASYNNISNSVEKFPAKSDSLARIQQSINVAQKFQQKQTNAG